MKTNDNEKWFEILKPIDGQVIDRPRTATTTVLQSQTRNQIVRHTFMVLMLTISTIGCFEPPNYSETPEIQFNNIDKYTTNDAFSGSKRDSVILTIDFKDGNGDLGEDAAGRSKGEYNAWGNYQLRTFKRIEGNKFEEVAQAANNKIFFPDLRPDRKKGPLEGKLDYSLYFPYSRSAKLTVVKFRIRIRDRALNLSNEIETDTISVPLVQ
jgi:hypothetical protein